MSSDSRLPRTTTRNIGEVRQAYILYGELFGEFAVRGGGVPTPLCVPLRRLEVAGDAKAGFRVRFSTLTTVRDAAGRPVKEIETIRSGPVVSFDRALSGGLRARTLDTLETLAG